MGWCHGIYQLTIITGEKLSSVNDAAKETLGEFEKMIREGNYSPKTNL